MYQGYNKNRRNKTKTSCCSLQSLSFKSVGVREKKIQIQESKDLSNHAYFVFSVSSLLSSIFSFLFFPLLFEILANKVSATSRHWATKLSNLNVVTLRHRNAMLGLALQSTPSSLHTASKCRRFRLKCTRSRVSNIRQKTYLLMNEMTRKHDKSRVYDEWFRHSSPP